MDESKSSSIPGGGTSFVILSVCIVGILATALLLLSYYLFLTRCGYGLLFFWRSDHRDIVTDHHQHHHHLHIVDIVVREQRRGLEGAAIRRIPTFRYQGLGSSNSNQKQQAEDKQSDDCAVCLSDFRHGERLRLLPSCRHAFHIDCIDAWLQATANCPLCRATVVSSVPEQQQLVDDVDDIVIEISDESPSPPPPPEQEKEEEKEQEQVQEQEQLNTNAMRSRRSLSMDSSTDKRFYLALQRMLQQQHREDDAKSPVARSRSLRRSFFSFNHSQAATILPL